MARAETENFPVASRAAPAAGSLPPARHLWLRPSGRRAGRLGCPATGWRLWTGSRRTSIAPMRVAPSIRCLKRLAADAARVCAAARAVRAPDRGQPRRSAGQPLSRPGRSCAAIAPVGRPGRRAGARRARHGHARADRAVRLDLHRAAADRALPGRRRGLRRRPRLSAGRGPRPLRLRRPSSWPASTPASRCAKCSRFEVARAQQLLDDWRAADRSAARQGEAGGRRLRGGRAGGARRDRARPLRRPCRPARGLARAGCSRRSRRTADRGGRSAPR